MMFDKVKNYIFFSPAEQIRFPAEAEATQLPAPYDTLDVVNPPVINAKSSSAYCLK